jgi:hypothetical protein
MRKPHGLSSSSSSRPRRALVARASGRGNSQALVGRSRKEAEVALEAVPRAAAVGTDMAIVQPASPLPADMVNIAWPCSGSER